MQKELLEKRLETVNKQINGNIIIAIICILVLVFVPVMKFENFMFKFSLEVIIAFFALIFSIFRGFTLRSKKEDIEAELSFYKEEKESKMEKKIIETRPESEFICEYCDKKLKSKEALNKHNEVCEEKKYREEKNTKITVWVIGILIFLGFSIYFLINNKLNLIPLILIGFIATPFFDKFFNHYKKKSNRLRHFEINWWKKAIAILVIILIFVLINWLIPECPKSCNDNNSCTNDFCSVGTGYKCMNTIKLNCKGNGICESDEYGTSDCPNCDDFNYCTQDYFDVLSNSCKHDTILGCYYFLSYPKYNFEMLILANNSIDIFIPVSVANDNKIKCMNGDVVNKEAECKIPDKVISFIERIASSNYTRDDIMYIECSSGKKTNSYNDCPNNKDFRIKCTYSNETIQSLDAKYTDKCLVAWIKWYIEGRVD